MPSLTEAFLTAVRSGRGRPPQQPHKAAQPHGLGAIAVPSHVGGHVGALATRVSGFAKSVATPGTAVAGLTGWLIGGAVGAAALALGYHYWSQPSCPSDADMRLYLSQIASGAMTVYRANALVADLDKKGCHAQAAGLAAAVALKGQNRKIDGSAIMAAVNAAAGASVPDAEKTLDQLPADVGDVAMSTLSNEKIYPHSVDGWKMTGPGSPSVVWKMLRDKGYLEAADEFIHEYLPESGHSASERPRPSFSFKI